MKTKARAIATTLACALVLAACGGAEESFDSGSAETSIVTTIPPAERTGTTTPPPTTVPPSGEESPLTGEVPLDFVAEIVADAAARTGVAAEDILVTVAESVLWSDGSLGCPQPGEMYTQAIVEGFRVVVDTGDEGELDYRTGGTNFWIICDPAER